MLLIFYLQPANEAALYKLLTVDDKFQYEDIKHLGDPSFQIQE